MTNRISVRTLDEVEVVVVDVDVAGGGGGGSVLPGTSTLPAETVVANTSERKKVAITRFI